MNYNYLYFFKFDTFFKLGVSQSPNSRANELLNKNDEQLNMSESIYISVNLNIMYAIESMLKNKYIPIDKPIFFPTECFDLKDLKPMIEDVEKFSNLFNLEAEVKHLSDDYVLLKYENGNFRIRALDSYRKMLARGCYKRSFEIIE